MKVSIIVPAFNAAETIGETLDSIVSQTYEAWEAIVVDDGSQDATWQIVSGYGRAEPRIHLVRLQQNGGVCAARNRGMAGADGELVLFLDADDLILETHLAHLVDRFVRDPELGAVYSGWTRFSPNGEWIEPVQWAEPEDAFQAMAYHILFPIHSCMVRRELVIAAGGWDTSFLACEDWDLWLRIARMGARFAAMPQVTALYRMRTDSASLDGAQMLRDGLRVLSLASSRDPRVPQPDARYKDGLPQDVLKAQRIYYLMWCAGIELGQKREATSLLQHVDWRGDVALEPDIVARILADSVHVAMATRMDAWPASLPERQEAIERFLLRLEEPSQIADLAGEVWRLFEEMVFEDPVGAAPVFMRKTVALSLDAEHPLADIEGQHDVERAICRVSMGSVDMGTLQLPVIDGLVTAYVLRDAIAAELAWPIVEQFFRRTLSDSLDRRTSEERTSIWRGDVCLLKDLGTGQDWQAALFQEAGWTLFLQEVWGRAAWSQERFYDAAWQEQEEAQLVAGAGDGIWLEVSQPLPDLVIDKAAIDVIVTVGGVPAGVVQASGEEGVVKAQVLRVAITRSMGFELCRVAVREGLLGEPLEGGRPLRERLAEAAAQRQRENVHSRPLALVDGMQRLPGDGAIAVLERASPQVIHTAQARRAALPVDTLADVELSASLFDQKIHVEGTSPVRRLFYGPELISRLSEEAPAREAQQDENDGMPGPASRSYGRRFLDFVTQPLRRSGAQQQPEQDAEPMEQEQAAESETEQLPILMYHRIAAETPGMLAPYTVTPEKFEEQLSFLRDAGYYSVTLEAWQAAMFDRRPLPGKAVLITFDDGYEDFGMEAWPLLKEYGFSATLFLVTGEMGGMSRWHRRAEEQLPLLSWDDVRRMRDEGLRVGAHSTTHKRLAAHSPSEIVREIIRSRIVLKQELGETVAALAYPYGSFNGVVCHLAGACGFTFGLTYEIRHAAMGDSLLRLPRIDVRGDDDLEDFVRKVQAEQA